MAEAEVAHVSEEWGIERTLPNWNSGVPFIEWRGWTGHDGWRVDYTADNVWSLAAGRRVFRRVRTVYRDDVTEPELATPPAQRTPEAHRLTDTDGGGDRG